MPRLLVVFLLVSFPLAAQSPIPTVLLPEQPVAEALVQPVGGGFPTAIATDGTNFLIVSTGMIRTIPLGQYAMLVDAQGEPLLKTSIRVGSGFSAAVAWSGREYLVVTGGAGETIGTRIDASGHVLNVAPIRISEGSMFGPGRGVAVEWDGGQFVVITVTPTGWMATRLSDAGVIIQSDIVRGLSLGVSPQIAAQDGITLLTWIDAARIHLKAMNAAGVVGEAVDIPDIHAASVLAADDGFVLMGSTADGLELQHLSPTGHPDRPPVKLPLDAQGGFRLIRSGPSYLLLFRSASDTPYRAVHINASGDLLDTPRDVTASPEEVQLVAATATAVLSSFATTSGWPGYQSYTTWARPLLEARPAVQVHRGYAAQHLPRVTWQGGHALVSWTEHRARGAVVGAPGVTDLAGDGSTAVAIASSPASTLHLFGRGGSPNGDFTPETLYALVNGEAVLLDEQMVDPRFVRAVWTGRDFLVVWTRGMTRSDIELIEIVGARLSGGGALIDGPHVVANAKALRDIALGASATQALVVYQAGGAARGVRLDAHGAWPTDDITAFADNHHHAESFSVASDGEKFFVSWINKAYGSIDDWIAGRVVDASGRAVTPLAGYSTGRDYKHSLAAFWTGENYLLIWSGGGERRGLWAARAAADGRLLDYPPVHVGAIDGYVTSIARAPSGQIAVAYVRDGRAYTRFITTSRRRAVARNNHLATKDDGSILGMARSEFGPRR